MPKRTFLVTDPSKGVGRALSHRLAADGHQVIGLARGADDPSFPGTLVSVDLTDRNATTRTLEGLVGRYTFDGVINNAGFVRLAGVEAVDLDDLEASFRHNLTSAVQTVQALLPGMRERGWGRIVNLSSLVVLGVANRTAYAAAKAAMMSFTRTWALELAQTGITVNAVAARAH